MPNKTNCNSTVKITESVSIQLNFMQDRSRCFVQEHVKGVTLNKAPNELTKSDSDKDYTTASHWTVQFGIWNKLTVRVHFRNCHNCDIPHQNMYLLNSCSHNITVQFIHNRFTYDQNMQHHDYNLRRD